jgi:DNA-binding beta-propeller fold protein YncE
MSVPDATPGNEAFDPPKSSFGGPIAEFVAQRVLTPPVRPGLLANLGRFEILRLVGGGGMGVVLLARDPEAGSQVAIKLVKPELLGDAQIKHRFLKEAGHMQKLKHRGIVPVTEIGESAEGPYFVMPYLEGGNLSRRIRPDQPLEPAAILDIAQPVAEGLQFAHRRGIIHRDLKPGNILLGPDGSACLADFGLARTVFNDTVVDAGTEQCEGTAPYMSPAVAEGHAEDTRCDIYAFGAILYEMLTGRPPYEGRTTWEVRRQIIAGPPAAIAWLNPKADARLAAVAEGAMGRELRDRYADMGDVVADLKRVRLGKRPLGPHGIGRKVRRLGRTSGTAVIVAAAVVLALAIWLRPIRWFAPAPVAAGPKAVPLGPPVPFHFHDPTGMAFDPQGNLYVSDKLDGVVYEVLPTGRVVPAAGLKGVLGGTDGEGDTARFSILRGLTFDSTGFIFYLSDGFRIRMISLHGPVWTLAGSFREPGSLDGPVRQARFVTPTGLAIDKAGNLYVADLDAIRKITPEGVVSTLAGSPGHAGREDGKGAAARFSDQPKGIAVSADGTVFVADGLNHRIRKISPTGDVTTLPGTFGRPAGIALDAAGDVVIADADRDAVFTLSPTGAVATLAGQAGTPGRADGPGAAARFNRPRVLAIDAAGIIWVADAGNQALRKITPAGVVTTAALFTQ